ncbi:Lipid A core - O-antigen ligase and related enzymes [Edwardsiella tarda]|nr:Lipid A core - O-antigen ligase and related enzymes [Edwardsiella tarda]
MLVLSFFSLNFLTINPVYPMMCIFIFLSFFLFFIRGRISKFSVYSILFIAFVTFCQVIAIYNPNPNLMTTGTSVNRISFIIFIISILYAISFFESFKWLSKDDRVRVYFYCGIIFFIYLLCEFFLRVFYGDLNRGILYGFKGSLMYFDSNFTGLVIMSFYMLFLFLKKYVSVKFKYFSLMCFLFLLLTVSRAAIISVIFSFFIFSSTSSFRKRSYFILTMYLLVFFMMSYAYFWDWISYSNIDGSFNSKFYIVDQAIKLYKNMSFESIIFGIGFGNFYNYMGIFAHNIFVTMFIEMGVLGSLAFIVFIFYSIRISDSYSLYIWVPTLIAGLSLFSVYTPFLFVINAILILEAKLMVECSH